MRLPALALVALTLVGHTAPLAAQVLTSEQVVTAATLPLPPELRAGATVLALGADGNTTTLLRTGTNGMTCLGPVPGRADFHVACYQESLEPFMARGRALRLGGVQGPQVDTVRFAEAAKGTLALPKTPASLYSLSGGVFDAASGTVSGARALYVIYVPYATTQTTGISARPSGSSPWLMNPGTPKAHIMFTPSM
jgi:hypothetical protein